MAHPERVQDALEKAFSFLAKRDRTAAQVLRRLAEKGIDEEVAAGALEELERQGYVDDERFARLYAEDRRNLDGWGSERISGALAEAGVDRGVIAVVLGDRERGDDLADALSLLERKCPTPPSDDRERERALAHLVRRGYELELAYDAVRKYEQAA